ncbi:hypothetical protein HF086_009555 [Spodoptera exigua]|uniref:Uncharacterized protein n=1 Tax=Spodoptera exigua TaxID=7107 RepID=A0A922S9T7_SPOEX|nr:hypothetical protein HF086_009555 [Spodoptera exigua]
MNLLLQKLKEKYDRHLKEKDLSRKEKHNDRLNIDETHICAAFDLQAVMQCPSDVSREIGLQLKCDNCVCTSENENKGNVTWSDIKILKFTKEDTFLFYYKTSYSQNEFNKVNMRNKRKKMSAIRDIAMTKAYSQRLVLSERKKTDLRSLIEHNLIPHYYADFYNNIM